MATVMPKIADFGKASAAAAVSTMAFNKAVEKLGKQKEAAAAMDKARKAMGMLTVEEEKGLKAQQKWQAHNDKFNDSFRDVGGEMSLLTSVIGAYVAVAGSVVLTLGGLAAAAISVTEENSKMLRTFTALGGSAAAGKEVMAVVDQLSEKLPLSRAAIGDMAKNLESAGFRGQALGRAVEAIAASTAIMGEEGGAATQKMLQTFAEGGKGADKMVKAIREGGPKANKELQKMGLSVDDFGTAAQRAKMSAEDMGKMAEKVLASKAAKSGALAEMGQTFPVMLMKMKEGFFSLFEGLSPAVKPFMAAVQSLFGQFTRSKGPMKALGQVAVQALGFIFKYATMAVRAISAFVAKNFTAKNVGSTWEKIKSAIAKVAVVLNVVWATLKPIFTSQSFLDGLAAIFKVIAVVVVAVAAGFAALTAVLGGLAGSVLNLVGIGANLISGLVDAVTSGAGAFVDAMSSLASKGLAAFKSVLGIHSPSAVMMQMGEYTTAGAAQGIDAGAGDVERSAVRMGAGVAGGAAKGMGDGGKGGGKGGGVVINIAPGALVINAGGSTITDEGFAIALERFAQTVGV